MKKASFPLILILLLVSNSIFAQSAIVRDYIAKYRDIAIAEMHRTGVPAAITLAQGILETEAGKSNLVQRSNNHFGIKCKSDWKGETVSHDDDARGECFRKYDDPTLSYKDHSDFLKTRAHYAPLFKLDPKDFQGWAYGLKKAGYATNPKYPQILIRIINEYNLQQYTMMALDRSYEGENNRISSNSTQSNEAKVEEPVKPASVEAVYAATSFITHRVLPRETLFAISKKYGVTIDDIRQWNNLASQDLKIGQQLRINKK
ncbi:MAG: LysM peptidoglycan-binding protein [Flaviaesturariibacter sp.]|nr:LysM peptidoglycan-binding protein [Flaviaesturariibacter sp.]